MSKAFARLGRDVTQSSNMVSDSPCTRRYVAVCLGKTPLNAACMTAVLIQQNAQLKKALSDSLNANEQLKSQVESFHGKMVNVEA